MPSGQWIIFDEMTSDSMGADRFSDDVITHSAEAYTGWEFEDFGDPAGGSRSQTDEKTCFEILRGKGIDIQPGEQTPAIRIESVKTPLNTMIGGQPGLLLHPRCKMLRRGFMGGYQFRRMQTVNERYVEKPEKNAYSHPHDALQYDATKLFADVLKSYDTNKWEPIQYSNAGIL